jgi:hypothetical protein
MVLKKTGYNNYFHLSQYLISSYISAGESKVLSGQVSIQGGFFNEDYTVIGDDASLNISSVKAGCYLLSIIDENTKQCDGRMISIFW